MKDDISRASPQEFSDVGCVLDSEYLERVFWAMGGYGNLLGTIQAVTRSKSSRFRHWSGLSLKFFCFLI